MVYTATDLRRNIYKILDRILATGEAAELERNGQRLRIVPVIDTPVVDRLRPIEGLIVGDPADLEHIDWSDTWKP